MNINAIMQQAKKMQADLEVKKESLAKEEFVIEKQGVTITIMGDRKIKSIKINEFLIDPEDSETLEDVLVVAVDAANELIDEKLDEISPKGQSAGFPL
ncbi:MAG: YbaB/EbfC family nucleoid-associated protein [Mycoplasma sp.]|nr:YbaB/EbfC family nucleoid-associated protein [Mycoplasma sp.]